MSVINLKGLIQSRVNLVSVRQQPKAKAAYNVDGGELVPIWTDQGWGGHRWHPIDWPWLTTTDYQHGLCLIKMAGGYRVGGVRWLRDTNTHTHTHVQVVLGKSPRNGLVRLISCHCRISRNGHITRATPSRYRISRAPFALSLHSASINLPVKSPISLVRNWFKVTAQLRLWISLPSPCDKSSPKPIIWP